MCYSAEASFAASGVLAAGSLAIARLPKERSGIPLSLFPAVFAAHQFIEGVQWLSQDGVLPAAFRQPAATAYALIAYVLWPVLVPLAAYMLETGRRRRMVILACQAIGLSFSLSVLLGLVSHPVRVYADCCSLSYAVDAPLRLGAAYLVAVSVPFLASSRRGLVLFGLAVLLSCLAAAVLASGAHFPSVWCFFAALLSGGLYLYFRAEAHSPARQVRAGATSAVAG